MFQTTLTSRVICWPARTLNLELKRRPAQMIHPHISEWINPKLRGFTYLTTAYDVPVSSQDE